MIYVDALTYPLSKDMLTDVERHNRKYRLGLYTAHLMARETALIDNIVDLLLETVQRKRKRAGLRQGKAAGRYCIGIH